MLILLLYCIVFSRIREYDKNRRISLDYGYNKYRFYHTSYVLHKDDIWRQKI